MKNMDSTKEKLLDKVQEGGWKSLTPKETGRIGGLMTKKKRELKNKENNA